MSNWGLSIGLSYELWNLWTRKFTAAFSRGMTWKFLLTLCFSRGLTWKSLLKLCYSSLYKDIFPLGLFDLLSSLIHITHTHTPFCTCYRYRSYTHTHSYSYPNSNSLWLIHTHDSYSLTHTHWHTCLCLSSYTFVYILIYTTSILPLHPPSLPLLTIIHTDNYVFVYLHTILLFISVFHSTSTTSAT